MAPAIDEAADERAVPLALCMILLSHLKARFIHSFRRLFAMHPFDDLRRLTLALALTAAHARRRTAEPTLPINPSPSLAHDSILTTIGKTPLIKVHARFEISDCGALMHAASRGRRSSLCFASCGGSLHPV